MGFFFFVCEGKSVVIKNKFLKTKKPTRMRLQRHLDIESMRAGVMRERRSNFVKHAVQAFPALRDGLA